MEERRMNGLWPQVRPAQNRAGCIGGQRLPLWNMVLRKRLGLHLWLGSGDLRNRLHTWSLGEATEA